jgi:hypothetical protein
MAHSFLASAIRRVLAAALMALCTEAAIAQTSAQTSAQTGVQPRAQTAALPRTADGHPDMQGVWIASFLSTLERPPGAPLVVRPEDEAQSVAMIRSFIPEVVDPDFNTADVRKLAEVRGELRTSLLVTPADGQLPFTQAGLAISSKFRPDDTTAPQNPEERFTSERCLTGFGQAPYRPFPSIFPMQLVQTPGAVLLVDEASGARIIDMTGRAPPADVRSLEGYSRGTWEGDTLVIETTHLRADDPLRMMIPRAMVAGPGSKVIERMQMLGPDTILFQFTIEDPAYYSKPWLAEYEFRRSPLRLMETACHVGNYALANMLKAGWKR